ncbi:MAG: PTS transporter subunit EIIC [Thomasclavelia sp.]|jgi:PTS system cellobiose-specific IIC component|nr:PTS transporter subunit EIIC [Thomasclavelia sp.]
MDKMADVLGRAGAWCGQNKYLSAVKNAFQNFMPFTIAGAVGVLWCNVLVNSSTGLGLFFKPIMALEVLNPAFSAVNFATISCITVGVTFGVGEEIGIWNLGQDQAGYIPGVVALSSLFAVTQSSFSDYALITGAGKSAKIVLSDGATTAFTGFSGQSLGATGLFTGMIIGILSVELFCAFSKMDALKIKMPETVPPGVARAFEVLIPAVFSITICSLIGLACYNLTGLYLNDVIKSSIQEPLQGVGSSIPGVMIIYIVIMLFWLVGIHGNNMLSAVKESLFTPLAIENQENYLAGKEPTNVINMWFLQMTGEFGGSGVTIGLVIAILIFGKRADNRAVAGISIVPGIFNINETVTFGIPMVLNPILGIPFVFVPCITIIVGYILTIIGFCPIVRIMAPWTCPPILFGLIATASPMGAITQAILIVISTVCYLPFLIAYERYQNKSAAEAAE